MDILTTSNQIHRFIPPLRSPLCIVGAALRLLPIHMGPGSNGRVSVEASAGAGAGAGGSGGGGGSGGVRGGAIGSIIEVYLLEVCGRGRNSWLDRLCLAVFDRRDENLWRVDEWERERESEGGRMQYEREGVSPPRSSDSYHRHHNVNDSNHSNNDHRSNNNNNNNNIHHTNTPPGPLPQVPNTYQSLVSQWEVNNEWDPDPSKEPSNVKYLAKIIAHGGMIPSAVYH